MRLKRWFFAAGTLLGLAAGFLLRPVIVRGPDSADPAHGAAASEMRGAGAATAPGKPGPRHSGGANSSRSPLGKLSSGDPETDLKALIASLEGLHDESGVNLMEVIRHHCCPAKASG